ncbi:MAG: hypothetical protein M0Z43_02960 [Acidithiobacillus sp.]|nr:hypothetical protein [Acidithiobacillus sp.]
MKLNEMYPSRFVRGRDLPAAILIKITTVESETVHPRPNVTEQAYVLRFERIDPRTGQPASIAGCSRTDAGYGVILRHTLAAAIAAILQSDDTDAWIDQRIVLEPARIRAAGQDVTTITARAPRQPKPKTAQATQEQTSDTQQASS